MTATASAATTLALPGRERTGYAVLIALAWFQVAFASHQFEHVTGDLFDACTVCKQLERHDTAAVHEPPASDAVAEYPLPVLQPAIFNPAKSFRAFQSRAPPAL